LDSSILIGDPESAMITHDRHILGDHYYRNKMYEKALLAINPSLKINSESKWVLHLLAARIYRKQGKLHEYEQSVNALLTIFLTPPRRRISF